jgi:hypothetical protein
VVGAHGSVEAHRDAKFRCLQCVQHTVLGADHRLHQRPSGILDEQKQALARKVPISHPERSGGRAERRSARNGTRAALSHEWSGGRLGTRLVGREGRIPQEAWLPRWARSAGDALAVVFGAGVAGRPAKILSRLPSRYTRVKCGMFSSAGWRKPAAPTEAREETVIERSEDRWCLTRGGLRIRTGQACAKSKQGVIKWSRTPGA